jgi:TPR repeat protein
MKTITILLVSAAAALAQGYYRPVAPVRAPNQPTCGHYGMKPCPVESAPAAVDIPPGATAEQLLDLCLKAYARKAYGVASAYCQPAADKGNTRAQASLGLMFMHGYGEPKDLKKALYWLTIAADKGHRVAQYQVGEFYEDGEGVPVDLAKTIHYYNLSAAQHYAIAERSLGVMTELGIGVPRSRPKAIALLKRAMVDGQDGFSQDLVTMLERPDTPRFANADEMSAWFAKLRG